MEKSSKVISIKDIAEIAGVSVATVSRVLNDKGKCSEATRKKVRAVAEQYGYVSNMAAKSLRESRSRTIGLILPNITNPFFSAIAYAIETCLFEADHSLFICNSGNSPARERAYFRSLVGRGVDGLLCISELSELPAEVVGRRIPLVSIDRRPAAAERIPWVGNDDAAASFSATELLLAKGCRRVAFISSFFSEYSVQNRREGYRRALEAHGLPFDRNLVIERRGTDPTYVETEILVYQALRSGLAIDGLIATSEAAGVGALYAARRAGLSVPEDVKLVCFDNTMISLLTSPALSSIERNPHLIAAESCRLLLRLIEGEEPEETEIFVPTQLIDRESTQDRAWTGQR